MRRAAAALLVAGTAATALAAPGPAALADTGVGNQNPALAVTGTLTRVITTEDDGLVANFSVTYKGKKPVRPVKLCGTIVPPKGGVQVFTCQTYRLMQGDHREDALGYSINSSTPRGTYTLRVRATTNNGLGASTATATFQVV